MIHHHFELPKTEHFFLVFFLFFILFTIKPVFNTTNHTEEKKITSKIKKKNKNKQKIYKDDDIFGAMDGNIEKQLFEQ